MKKTINDIDKVCMDAERINGDNLREILFRQKDTFYGKMYGFGEIKDIDQYRKNVPLVTYKDLQIYIEKMRKGEQNILTVDSLEGFCITTGTEGHSKYIPITKISLERYADYIEWYRNQCWKDAGGKKLFLNFFRVSLTEKNKSGNLLSEIYYQYLFREGYLSFDEYAGGEAFLFGNKEQDIFYGKVWLGFCTEDITGLLSIFLYDQLLFFRYMETHWEEILEDISLGRVRRGVSLSQEAKKYLISLPVEQKRIQHVRQECEKGFEGIALRLWKNLALASGISNPAFSVEDSTLRRYLGSVPLHYFSYVASECHIGVAVFPEDFSFVLLPESAFFEFLPYSENGHGEDKTLLPQEVECGKMYEVIITNFSGLYRYKLGDIVCVRGFYKGSPRLEFAFRKHQMLNIAGEKVSVLHVERVIASLVEICGLAIQAYSGAALLGEIPAYYGFVFDALEIPERNQWQGIAKKLDQLLQIVNLDYKDVRNMGYVGMPEVLFLKHEDYQSFMEESHLNGGHRKPRHTAAAFPAETWKKWRTEKWKN